MKTIRYTLPHVATRFRHMGPTAPNAHVNPEPPVRVKPGGDGRDPHAGEAVSRHGSIEGWQHGHYDYSGNKGKGGC